MYIVYALNHNVTDLECGLQWCVQFLGECNISCGIIYCKISWYRGLYHEANGSLEMRTSSYIFNSKQHVTQTQAHTSTRSKFNTRNSIPKSFWCTIPRYFLFLNFIIDNISNSSYTWMDRRRIGKSGYQ